MAKKNKLNPERDKGIEAEMKENIVHRIVNKFVKRKNE